jgi:hypothetical protein
MEQPHDGEDESISQAEHIMPLRAGKLIWREIGKRVR